jgi:hypothetical protein
MNSILEERLNLKTYIACKDAGIKPETRHKKELVKVLCYMQQDFEKTLLDSLGSYDKKHYYHKNGCWYIAYEYHSSKQTLLITGNSCIVKTQGFNQDV